MPNFFVFRTAPKESTQTKIPIPVARIARLEDTLLTTANRLATDVMPVKCPTALEQDATSVPRANTNLPTEEPAGAKIVQTVSPVRLLQIVAPQVVAPPVHTKAVDQLAILVLLANTTMKKINRCARIARRVNTTM